MVNAKKCLRFLFINNFYQSILDPFDMFFLKTTEPHGIFTDYLKIYSLSIYIFCVLLCLSVVEQLLLTITIRDRRSPGGRALGTLWLIKSTFGNAITIIKKDSISTSI